MKIAGIISLLSLLFLLSPSFPSSASYFIEEYNPIPIGDPNQLQMSTWGYFTDVGVYENNYRPVVGDEVGVFWTNQSAVDILVGVETLDSTDESNGWYGPLIIYGDYGLASGLVNGETVYYRVYSQSRDAVYPAFPSLIFAGSYGVGVVNQHDLAVPTPAASPTPAPMASATPTASPSATPSAAPSPPSGLILAARLFLEGSYSESSMSTALLDNEYIPLTSPYADAMEVDGIPAGTVDWVYIQLRESSGGATVSERSAFLKSDGYLMDDGGGETILMPYPEGGEGDYHIVVRYRNHLDIMSSGTHYLGSSNSTPYDFTTGEDKAWGTNPMKELDAGVYGMFAGDADGSGEVDGADYGLVFGDSDRSGCRDTDVNLSGVTDSTDRIMTFNNQGIASQVP